MIDLDSLTPKEIVKELDKYIIGQEKAKKAVAIALRNRMRRQMLSPEMREEISRRFKGRDCTEEYYYDRPYRSG